MIIIQLGLLYLLLGCAATFLSGLFGIGGGLIVVPALLFLFSHFQVVESDQMMHVVIGTSMASSIVTLIFAVLAHQKRRAIRWEITAKFAPGLVLGSLFLGPWIALFLKTDWLKIVFAVFCLVMAIQIFLHQNLKKEPERLPGYIGLSIFGVINGALSSLLGISGGAISSAILNFYRMNIRQVIATASALSLIIAISGSVGLMFAGWGQVGLPKWSTGFIDWPAWVGITMPSPYFAWLGAKYAHKFNPLYLKRLLGVFLIVVAVNMIL